MVTLHVENLTLRYGKHAVFNSLGLEPISAGTMVGLLGPNASGKSTLIKSLAQVFKPAAGNIFLTEGDTQLSGRSLREVCGYMPQDLPGAISLTAFETALLAAKRSCPDDPIATTAHVFSQLGITEIGSRRLGELSGGQRQMVAASQMLVGTPQLLLLDEPTSALDLNRQIQLLSVVRQRVIDTNAIAIVALHDINLAGRWCDELVVLHRGHKAAQGPSSAVITPELISQVYGVTADVIDHQGHPIMVPTDHI